MEVKMKSLFDLFKNVFLEPEGAVTEQPVSQPEVKEVKEFREVRTENKSSGQQDSPVVNPLILEARAKAKEIVIEAKDRALKVREEAEEEVRRTRERTIELEKNLAVRKAQIESQEHEIESKTKT